MDILLRDFACDFGVEFESSSHREIFEISLRAVKNYNLKVLTGSSLRSKRFRGVQGLPKSSYHQLLNRANLPSLLNRRLQDICVLMYKVKQTKMCSETITNIFKPRDSCYSLRNSDFLLPRFNTVSFGKHSLRYLGPILWSKLDKNDRTCK